MLSMPAAMRLPVSELESPKLKIAGESNSTAKEKAEESKRTKKITEADTPTAIAESMVGFGQYIAFLY